jgi:membrane protein insertase, YidC/Oxa1 family, C-terminal domain
MNFRDKKFKKIIFMLFIMLVLVGCTANVDKDGVLKASRAIDETTKWSFSAGWFDFFLVIPLTKLMMFFSNFVDVMPSLIIVTVIVNLITLPLMVRSTVASEKMSQIQPMIDRIAQKYRGRNDQNSKMRMSAEQQALYKKYDIKMGRTLLLPFLSLPIMLAVWQCVQRWTAMYDTTFLGLDMTARPSAMIPDGYWGYLIVIIVMAVSQFVSVQAGPFLKKISKNYKNNRKPANNMQTANIFMTVMFVFMAYSMGTAMSIYWIVTSIISIVRAVYIHFAYIEKMSLKHEASNKNYLNKKKG